MYGLIRPLLFRADPERAHAATLQLLRLAGRIAPVRALLGRRWRVDDPRLEVEAFGLRFPNPVGLAAGYDKNGVALRGLASLGFGHLEVGTLTRQPQAGNPRPRVHRFPVAEALVNSMGFPNAGIESLPASLAALGRATGTRIGVNLGKGRDTPLDRAADDYGALLRHVHAHRQADYVAINISSPNTKDLRRLQDGAAVASLLRAVAAERDGLSSRLPVLVKIAPDLSEAEVDAILDAVLAAGIDGVIATNTTTSRERVPQAAGLPGGASGAPVRERSTAIVRYIAARTEGRLPIVGVGGILRPADALEKIQAGAWLVQVYTGLVYTGPGLVHAINLELLRACASAGAAHIGTLRRPAQPAPGGSYAPR
jgi:dihydroorotate dehydrogenase